MKKIILAVLATAFVTAQAYAFSGSVFMMGSVRTHQNAGNTNTVSFKNPGWTVLAAPAPDGAYTGTAGAAVTFTSFTYNPTTNAIITPAVTPFQLWSFAFGGHTYTFD